MSQEIGEILKKQSAKEKSIAEKFRSKGGSKMRGTKKRNK